MTPQSAKNKGRILCKQIKKLILSLFPILEEDDLKVTSSGATGEDIQLSPKARSILPITIECKNRNSISVYKWMEQSDRSNYIPIVVAKANHKEPLVILYASDYFNLLKEVYDLKKANTNS